MKQKNLAATDMHDKFPHVLINWLPCSGRNPNIFMDLFMVSSDMTGEYNRLYTANN